jgi:hypothetical protein
MLYVSLIVLSSFVSNFLLVAYAAISGAAKPRRKTRAAPKGK